jgi:hypothetical protein
MSTAGRLAKATSGSTIRNIAAAHHTQTRLQPISMAEKLGAPVRAVPGKPAVWVALAAPGKPAVWVALAVPENPAVLAARAALAVPGNPAVPAVRVRALSLVEQEPRPLEQELRPVEAQREPRQEAAGLELRPVVIR